MNKILMINKIRSFFSEKKPIDPLIKKLTPPKNINYNGIDGNLGYERQFSYIFLNYYYPYILQNCRIYGVNSSAINLLDIGCGWGPMAIPFLMSEKTKHKSELDVLRYLGIDIREDAITWLTKAYKEYPFIQFQHHQSDSNVDYVGGELNQSKTLANSNGEETAFCIPKNFTHNVQWSSSVFTHLTPKACRRALEVIINSSAQNSIQINTWLIIDDESRYALSIGVADRILPIDHGEYMTTSEENPLACTAYKIESIHDVYTSAGLEILRIDRGSWRGNAVKNDAHHYQDIVISRRLKKLT